MADSDPPLKQAIADMLRASPAFNERLTDNGENYADQLAQQILDLVDADRAINAANIELAKADEPPLLISRAGLANLGNKK